MTVDKKTITLIILVLISYVFLLRPQFAKRNKVVEELRTKKRILTECFSTREKLPTEDAVIRFRESNDKLKKDYQSMAREVFHQTISENTLPFEKEKWPLYFRKTLYVTTAELIAEARKRKAKIPSSFGFASNIPSEEEVIPLLNKLGLIRGFILTALNSGVTEITGLRLMQEDSAQGKESPKKSEGEQPLEQAGRSVKGKGKTQGIKSATNTDTGFIEEWTLIVKLSCDTKALFKLLHTFQKDYSFFLIKNIQVKRSEDRLIVDLLLSALYEKKALEKDTMLQKKKDHPVL